MQDKDNEEKGITVAFICLACLLTLVGVALAAVAIWGGVEFALWLGRRG